MAATQESRSSSTIPEEDPLARLKSKLRSDFYASFRFAQGETFTPLHLFLLRALALKHGEKTSLDLLRQISRDQEFGESLSSLMPPKNHIRVSDGGQPISAEKAHETFDYYRGTFTSDLLLVADNVTTRESERYLPREIARLTIARDIFYQYEHNMRQYPPNDPHTSLFREHILLGRPTGSEAFNEIFSEAGAFAADQSSQGQDIGPLPELAQLWELNHPGESFFQTAA